jgi:hypothetical protein
MFITADIKIFLTEKSGDDFASKVTEQPILFRDSNRVLSVTATPSCSVQKLLLAPNKIKDDYERGIKLWGRKEV